MRLYLVGGALRDLLLGNSVTDRDFVFIGPESDFQAAYPKAVRVSKSFPIYIHQGDEYAPPRGEDIHQDLAARDLTVNALALGISPEEIAGTLYMHPRALEDLKNRVLRPASPQALAQDPIRVLRAARFLAEMPDFFPHKALERDAKRIANSGLLRSAIAERVGKELEKALAAPEPGRFFQFLDRVRGLDIWFRELAKASAIPAGPPPFHDSHLLDHITRVMSLLRGNALAVYMGLCHDLGKTVTPPENWPHHYRHEHLGENLATDLGRRLKLSERLVQAGRAAARLHMKAGTYLSLRTGTRVDLLVELYRLRLVNEMFALARADRAAKTEDCDLSNSGYDHEQVMAQVERDLERILSVRLPKEWRDKGAASGIRLRELRCQALVG